MEPPRGSLNKNMVQKFLEYLYDDIQRRADGISNYTFKKRSVTLSVVYTYVQIITAST
jgi:hypothetical protein